MTNFDRYFQLHGELDDFQDAFSVTPNTSLNNEPGVYSKRVTGSGSCSAIIKVLPGNSDLLVGHNTWTSYINMIRIFKRYELRYQVSTLDTGLIPGHTQVFSSYPGRLYSGDDFYLLSSGLVRPAIPLSVFLFISCWF